MTIAASSGTRLSSWARASARRAVGPWPPAAGGEPAVAPAVPAGPVAAEEKTKGAPWHFKLLVVGVTVYMVYRIYWLIEWLPKHI